ncbi:HDOD domain-containing protein [Phytohalomonas tamaricis]|uniref:HDOD domain-containing protein n=1 Tax=Phytohalomonas tamaricis TaxID=2081032 RepID=UPI000D0BC076|nr:HDOD domain-containing protein [Phytohalomonas tamaricis]
MSIEQLFDQIKHLPNVPAVVMALIERFDDEHLHVSDVANNIKKDPNLTLKVLRLANSTRYGAGRNVASIDDAVVILGFDSVRTLVIASGVVGALKVVEGLDPRQFWRDSFMVASIARLIARNSPYARTETAFTCGVLHNIGATLMHIAHPEPMKHIDRQVEKGAEREPLEHDEFGYDYTQAGAELLRRWRFPEELCIAIAYQNDPLARTPFSPYAAVLHLASYLHGCIKDGRREEEAMAHFPSEVRQPLALDLLTLYDDILALMDEKDDIDFLLS